MKYLFLILLLSFSALASNWMPISKIQEGSKQAYTLESDCKKSGEQCLDVDPSQIAFITLQNDWGPEQEVQACAGQSECEDLLEEKVCAGELSKFIDEAFTKVYCVELLGKELVLDSVGYDAHVASKAAQAQLEAGIAVAKSLRECGARVMDLMLVRNQPKQLSVQQVETLLGAYSDIQLQLSSGSLVTAKTSIQAVAADGVIVTEGDKTALVAEIDKCLGL